MIENASALVGDFTVLKYGFGAGLALFIIRELFKLVYFLLQQKKAVPEQERKERTREMISDVHTFISRAEPVFWDGKGKLDGIHEVITAKNEGVPIVYNKGLERALMKLDATLNLLAQKMEDHTRSGS